MKEGIEITVTKVKKNENKEWKRRWNTVISARKNKDDKLKKFRRQKRLLAVIKIIRWRKKKRWGEHTHMELDVDNNERNYRGRNVSYQEERQ